MGYLTPIAPHYFPNPTLIIPLTISTQQLTNQVLLAVSQRYYRLVYFIYIAVASRNALPLMLLTKLIIIHLLRLKSMRYSL